MTDIDRDPVPAIILVTALLISACVGVLLVDSLITSRELRKAARRLRDFPDGPTLPPAE